MAIRLSENMVPPPHYRCGKCGAQGVRLIRVEFEDDAHLRCHGCAMSEHPQEEAWFPAIPDGPEGIRYLNRSIEYKPQREMWDVGLRWWHNLPQKSSCTAS